MLKKAGIVVAAAAAGLLAVSPLAFAGSKDDDHDGDKHVVVQEGDGGNNACENDQDAESGTLLGIITLNGNNVNALQCNNVLNNNDVDVDVL